MAVTIAATAVLDPGVDLGDGSVVGDYALLGCDPAGWPDRQLRVGSAAHVRSHTVIYRGNVIGRGFQTGHGVLIREANEIGNDVSIGSHSIVEHHTQIGHGVRIHSNAFIPEFSLIEDGAWIGPSVTFTNARYPRSRDVKDNLVGPIIRRAARIGANATLLPGIVVGPNALVGAGSVVTRDVPEGVVVAGNPARVIRTVAELGVYGDD